MSWSGPSSWFHRPRPWNSKLNGDTAKPTTSKTKKNCKCRKACSVHGFTRFVRLNIFVESVQNHKCIFLLIFNICLLITGFALKFPVLVIFLIRGERGFSKKLSYIFFFFFRICPVQRRSRSVLIGYVIFSGLKFSCYSYSVCECVARRDHSTFGQVGWDQLCYGTPKKRHKVVSNINKYLLYYFHFHVSDIKIEMELY